MMRREAGEEISGEETFDMSKGLFIWWIRGCPSVGVGRREQRFLINLYLGLSITAHNLQYVDDECIGALVDLQLVIWWQNDDRDVSGDYLRSKNYTWQLVKSSRRP